MFGSDRNTLRQFYQTCWRKAQHNEVLTDLEKQVAQVISEHPEYQQVVLRDSALDKDWQPENGETNPFLHMGMHLALREQVSTDRPSGIARHYIQLCQHTQNPLEAEHAMMECLAEVIWQAQKQQQAPNEADYLACLAKLSPL